MGLRRSSGRSAPGKSLTLQCLAGLGRPDAGRIVVDGHVLFDGAAGIDVPPQRRRVGYVFQGYALFPHLTVRGNVGFGLRDRGRAERRRRVDEVLARLALEAFAERYPRSCRAASVSGSPWGVRSPPILPCSCSTSRSPRSTCRSARRCATSCAASSWAGVSPRCWSPTTSPRPTGWATVSWSTKRGVSSRRRPRRASVAAVVPRRGAHHGIRNLVQGVTLKATPDGIQVRWRGQVLEAVNSPTRAYLPAPGSPLAFFIRPEYVRLVRKDRDPADSAHHMNLMSGTIVREVDLGVTWTLYIRLDEPGAPAQGDYDLEVEVPRLVYEILEISAIGTGSLPASRLDPRPAFRMTPPLVPRARAGRARGRIAAASGELPRGFSTRGLRPRRPLRSPWSRSANRFVDAVSERAEAFHQEVTSFGQLHASSDAFSRAGRSVRHQPDFGLTQIAQAMTVRPAELAHGLGEGAVSHDALQQANATVAEHEPAIELEPDLGLH